MTIMNQQHPSEEVLESYSMGRLSESEVDSLVEHIIVCDVCQDKLHEVDDFIKAFRAAAPSVETAESKPQSSWFQRFAEAWRGSGMWRPLPVTGALVTAALAVVMLAPRQAEVTGARTLDLHAVRSVDGAQASTTESLTLNLDIQGLPPQGSYHVMIANAAGETVWRGQASPAAAILTISPGALRASGPYWVRVQRDDSNGSLLREYALEVVEPR
jgi:hypothetical protein